MDVPDLQALEEALLDPEVRRSPARLAALIADDFVEFGSSGGVFHRSDVLDAADRLPHVRTPLDDFAVEHLSDDAALVTYRSTAVRADGSLATALRSSLWVRRDGRWQLRFHQGTPVDDTPGGHQRSS